MEEFLKKILDIGTNKYKVIYQCNQYIQDIKNKQYSLQSPDESKKMSKISLHCLHSVLNISPKDNQKDNQNDPTNSTKK